MKLQIENIVFDKNGLIPAIVQDQTTGDVLMLAYMNKEAITKTLETKETWFYSRSRQELWNKGATSGNRQQVKRISLDCDQDAILIEVIPLGPACHTGEESCFYQTVYGKTESTGNIIDELQAEIRNRKEKPVEGSYTSYLFREGLDKILKKIGEESSEVIIGAKNRDKKELTSELADLAYHTLVLMEESEVSLEDIKKELRKRRSKGQVNKDE